MNRPPIHYQAGEGGGQRGGDGGASFCPATPSTARSDWVDVFSVHTTSPHERFWMRYAGRAFCTSCAQGNIPLGAHGRGQLNFNAYRRATPGARAGGGRRRASPRPVIIAGGHQPSWPEPDLSREPRTGFEDTFCRPSVGVSATPTRLSSRFMPHRSQS